ncbi:MAG: Holliday junction resolvase RuvX [Oscillospiraceae bacterium]|nr:Holliday junction resolvase RuvX [Oscillospiraceae bacterium]
MKIMAIDLGDERTGLAVCDKTEFLASPVGTIVESDQNQILKQVAVAVKEHDAEMVVVGCPRNMDGSYGERAKKCEQFAELLKKTLCMPIVLWDERQSTLQAHQYLNSTNTRGKNRKKVIDEVAATIILQSYLSYRKNHPEKS